MPTFKRVSLAGSEELFRPTRPQVVTDTDEVIRSAVDRPAKVKEVVYRTLNFTPEEIELLLEAIQTAKYPDRVRVKPALDKFDSLDALRIKVQGAPEHEESPVTTSVALLRPAAHVPVDPEQADGGEHDRECHCSVVLHCGKY